MSRRRAIIIGAGPAGLTAAYELLTRSDIVPIVLEKSSHMGGISRTVNYKGNRIDIGGHRFFSKSDRVMNWWLSHLPMDAACANGNHIIRYRQQSRELHGLENGNASHPDAVMLVRRRRSRIYFLRRFFDYPIRLTPETLRNLGAWRTLKIGTSYLWTMAFPPKRVENLEEFFISRFGRELYETFFKSYTEKVWGVPCREISAEWGQQRIKGLSIKKTIAHFFRQLLNGGGGVQQKDTETSLIEQFLYPKYGPGQMWETVAEKVTERGGQIRTHMDVVALRCQGNRVASVTARDEHGCMQEFEGEYFFSTMPVQELVRKMETPVPAEVREVSDNLLYRDFITVGLLLDDLKVREEHRNGHKLITDNWIYIQEPDVHAGRLQIFNNWSPHLIADPETVWIGVEYFCYESDQLWQLPDEKMAELAKAELDKIGIIDRGKVLDWTVIRMPKAYPAYFGAYDRFDEVRRFADGFENLFLVGRNGMHKYNNQDHSMLTAMTAVDNILAGITGKENIWAVNTEMEYHEGK